MQEMVNERVYINPLSPPMVAYNLEFLQGSKRMTMRDDEPPMVHTCEQPLCYFIPQVSVTSFLHPCHTVPAGSVVVSNLSHAHYEITATVTEFSRWRIC